MITLTRVFALRLSLATLAGLLAAIAGDFAGARAQTPPPILPVPQGSPIPFIAPRAGPSTSIPAAPAPLPQPTALPAANVAVTSVAIEGATAYPAARLLAFTKSLVGPQTSLHDIEEARRGILLLYRNDGYPFIVVAVRIDKSGALRFLISEGYISEVKLSGDIGPVGTLVLKFLNHLTEQHPINNATIERWLLLAQSIPGLQIQPVMQKSETTPGAFTLVAKVSVNRVSGSLAVDNNADPQSGAGEGLLTVGLNSLTAWGERSEAALYFSGPNGQQTFGQFSEQAFIGGSGLSVRLYVGHGNTLPCCDLRTIRYDGLTTVYGAQLSYPLLLSRQQQLYLRASLDAVDSDTQEQGARASGDSVRALRLSGDYSLSDIVLGDTRQGDSHVSVVLSKGLSILGASVNGRADAGRLNENLDFSKVSGYIDRDQTLLTVPNGPRISLYGLATGQGTSDVLPSVEQFYLGGIHYTRGFYAGEVTGDNALAGTGELRVTSHFTLDAFGTEVPITPQFYLFYDWGETWQNQTSDRNQILRSYGGGVRTGITQYMHVDLQVLRRITRQVGGPETSPLAAEAFYARLVTEF